MLGGARHRLRRRGRWSRSCRPPIEQARRASSAPGSGRDRGARLLGALSLAGRSRRWAWSSWSGSRRDRARAPSACRASRGDAPAGGDRRCRSKAGDRARPEHRARDRRSRSREAGRPAARSSVRASRSSRARARGRRSPSHAVRHPAAAPSSGTFELRSRTGASSSCASGPLRRADAVRPAPPPAPVERGRRRRSPPPRRRRGRSGSVSGTERVPSGGRPRRRVAMMGGGLCWLDYDGDGWLDLFVVNSYSDPTSRAGSGGDLPRSALFHNEDGTFVDVSRRPREPTWHCGGTAASPPTSTSTATPISTSPPPPTTLCSGTAGTGRSPRGPARRESTTTAGTPVRRWAT